MDFLYPYLLHLVILALSLFLIFLVYFKHSKFPPVKLPPGTKGWPFIGESLAFLMTSRRGHPEKFINDRVTKYSADVFQTSLLGENMAVFCGAAGNKLLFTSENKYVKAWWPKSLLKAFLVPDPDEFSFKEVSTGYRRILTEFLKPEALQRSIPVMDSMAREHLKTDWHPFKEVKVFPLIRKYSFALSCRLFISIKDPNLVSKLLGPFALVSSGMLSVPINFPGTPYYKAIKASKVINHDFLEIMNRRKLELAEKKNITSPDLLTRLLLHKEDDGRSMTDAGVYSRIMALLFASHDTISTAITFMFKHLAEHPHVSNRVFKEQMEIAKSKEPGELLNWEDIQKMKYTWCVACETMRLLPPSQGAFREAITDFTYAGFTIPKGWKIYWTVHSTHKNPKYFPDPEKFDPSRYEGDGPAPYTFVPFGGGPVMCPGREYARLEILIFMHNMVTKFKWHKVIEGEKIIFHSAPIPVKGLPILLEPL
ncbi:beta-amyrin 6-beta-monooxygenase [Ricinus communis]|uniref:Cytochrome P450, putative n=1 Tax=Ricinus communis TaxID=3988 RepID=B9SLD0_RICCO|nr:beta-amyrin 6-beta-monooxygenase [Ricinus communis]EEF35534.1 cytochrome P450, putative [Ricinus communis]|eukprot:XP_002526799.1 beta-amyrin 28-oxidase [Ricinus communis]